MSDPTNHQHYPFDLTALPVGWSARWIGDVTTEVSPGFPSGKHNRTGTGVPHLRPMNVSPLGEIDLDDVKHVAADADKRRLQVGDVLFNNTNSPAWVGKTACIRREDDLAFSNHMTRIRFRNEIMPEFAATQMHYLQVCGYFRHRCRNHVNQASVASKTLAQTVPLIFPSLDEQQRIVERVEPLLSDVDAGVASLRRARRKTAAYRASVLKAATTGTLTADWREQHPQGESTSTNPDAEPADRLLARLLTARRDRWEQVQQAAYAKKGKRPPKNWQSTYKPPVEPDVSDLPDLPTGWCWASIDQLGKLDRGRSRHRPRGAKHLHGGPHPFIQTGDVRASNQYIREHRQTYSDAGLEQSRLWPANTLCITIAANIAETGILAYPMCFPDSVVGVTFEAGEVSVQYVELFLRTARDRLDAYAPATAQKNINNEILRAVAVPLPPLAEQREIVDRVEERLSVADAATAALDAVEARAARLRQSILRDAFTGRLTAQPAAAAAGSGGDAPPLQQELFDAAVA
jgi:type I restriction enzyme S subunit